MRSSCCASTALRRAQGGIKAASSSRAWLQGLLFLITPPVFIVATDGTVINMPSSRAGIPILACGRRRYYGGSRLPRFSDMPVAAAGGVARIGYQIYGPRSVRREGYGGDPSEMLQAYHCSLAPPAAPDQLRLRFPAKHVVVMIVREDGLMLLAGVTIARATWGRRTRAGRFCRCSLVIARQRRQYRPATVLGRWRSRISHPAINLDHDRVLLRGSFVQLREKVMPCFPVQCRCCRIVPRGVDLAATIVFRWLHRALKPISMAAIPRTVPWGKTSRAVSAVRQGGRESDDPQKAFRTLHRRRGVCAIGSPKKMRMKRHPPRDTTDLPRRCTDRFWPDNPSTMYLKPLYFWDPWRWGVLLLFDELGSLFLH